MRVIQSSMWTAKMVRATKVIAVLALATLASCGDDGDDGAGGDDSGEKPRLITAEECQRGCSITLGCPNDNFDRCQMYCRDLNEAVTKYPQCSDDLWRALQCGEAQPIENYECDAEDGETSLKDEFCYTEYSTWGACIKQARGGL